jgi:ATP-dependent protease ClpP protease subunit
VEKKVQKINQEIKKPRKFKPRLTKIYVQHTRDERRQATALDARTTW